MIKLCKKDCSRQTVQHKKAISDQANACTQREDKEWKYQKKSGTGGMVCKQEFSQVDRSGGVLSASALVLPYLSLVG